MPEAVFSNAIACLFKAISKKKQTFPFNLRFGTPKITFTLNDPNEETSLVSKLLERCLGFLETQPYLESEGYRGTTLAAMMKEFQIYSWLAKKVLMEGIKEGNLGSNRSDYELIMHDAQDILVFRMDLQLKLDYMTV